MDKLCPLSFVWGTSPNEKELNRKCIKEKCAWWTRGACAIKKIALRK